MSASTIALPIDTNINGPHGQKLLLTKLDAAKALSVSVRTIENLIANKELAIRRIGRRVLIPHEVLVRFTRRDHSTR